MICSNFLANTLQDRSVHNFLADMYAAFILFIQYHVEKV